MIIKNLSNLVEEKQLDDIYLQNKKNDDTPITVGMCKRWHRFKLLCKLVKVILTPDPKY